MYNKSFPSQVCHLVSRIQSNSDHLFNSVINLEKLINENHSDRNTNSSTYYKNKNLSSLVSLNVLTTTIAQQIFMAAIDEFVDTENDNKSHRELGYELLMSLNKICNDDEEELDIVEENKLIKNIIEPISELIKDGYKTKVDDDDMTKTDIYSAIGFHCASEYFGSIEMSTVYNNLLINKDKPFYYLLNDGKFDANWVTIHANCVGNVEEEHFKHSTNAVAYLLYYLKDQERDIFLDVIDQSINDFCNVLDFFIEKTVQIFIQCKRIKTN